MRYWDEIEVVRAFSAVGEEQPVSPPVDLYECTMAVHRGLNRLYELRYVRDCRRVAEPGLRDGRWPGAQSVSPWASLFDFDEAISAGDVDAATEQLKIVSIKLDKSAATSTMHKGTAARKKSRLAKQLNSLKSKKV